MDILIDTNAYVAFKRGQSEAVEVIRRAPRIVMSSIVLGELLGGFAVGSREAANKKELRQFLESDRVTLRSVDETTAEYYATVYRNLRQKGRPIPSNDMWIAASALQDGLAVFSYDQHFHFVDGILVGSNPSDLSL